MGESTGSFPSPVLCAELGRRLPRARVLRNLGSLGLPRAPLHSQPLGISPRSVAGIETRGRSACESQSKARPRGRRGERRASIEVALLVLIGPSTRRRERGSRALGRSRPRVRGDAGVAAPVPAPGARVSSSQQQPLRARGEVREHGRRLPLRVSARLRGAALRDGRQRVPFGPLPERRHLSGQDRRLHLPVHARCVAHPRVGSRRETELRLPQAGRPGAVRGGSASSVSV